MRTQIMVLLAMTFASCGGAVETESEPGGDPESVGEVVQETNEFPDVSAKKPMRIHFDARVLKAIKARQAAAKTGALVKSQLAKKEAPVETVAPVQTMTVKAGAVDEPVMAIAMTESSPLARGMIVTVKAVDGGKVRDRAGFAYFGNACLMGEGDGNYSGPASLAVTPATGLDNGFVFDDAVDVKPGETEDLTVKLTASIFEDEQGDLFGRTYEVEVRPLGQPGEVVQCARFMVVK